MSNIIIKLTSKPIYGPAKRTLSKTICHTNFRFGIATNPTNRTAIETSLFLNFHYKLLDSDLGQGQIQDLEKDPIILIG